MSLSSTELKSHITKKIQGQWRRIVTDVPAPASLSAIKALRAVEPVSMQGMPPILWEEAEGFLVRDAYGNQKYENGKYNYDIELADAIVNEAVRRGVMMFPTHRGFLKIVPPLCN